MIYKRFRHLAIETELAAPTLAEIEAIESVLGAKLPSSFREYLDVANGGHLEYVVDIDTGIGRTEPISFCGLYSTAIGDYCDETFVGEIRSCRDLMKIPPGVLPFGRDGGGSMVLLDLSEEGSGRVVAFVAGLPSWAGVRTESAFIEIASSFDEYVDKLYIDREMVLDHLRNDATEPSHLSAYEEWLAIGLPDWVTDDEIGQAMAEARVRVGG